MQPLIHVPIEASDADWKHYTITSSHSNANNINYAVNLFCLIILLFVSRGGEVTESETLAVSCQSIPEPVDDSELKPITTDSTPSMALSRKSGVAHTITTDLATQVQLISCLF